MSLPTFDELWQRLCSADESASTRADIAPLRPESPGLRSESAPLRSEFDALRSELPDPIRSQLAELGRRATPEELDAVLIALASWKPLSLEELSALTGRATTHLRMRNIKRLLTECRLGYLYPEEPNHPDQKYVAADQGGAA